MSEFFAFTGPSRNQLGGTPMVVVNWEDAWLDVDPPEAGFADGHSTWTLGYLWEQTETHVRIASEVTPDGPRAVTSIPRAVVLGMHTLGITDPEDDRLAQRNRLSLDDLPRLR